MQDLEKNKQTALRLLDLAFGEGRPEVAARECLGDTYTQHSPAAPDGKEAFVEFARGWFERTGGVKVEHHRVFAVDDFVILHSVVQVPAVAEAEAHELAIVDLFRFDETGRIVEHWDVIQQIPAESRNSNPMV